MLPPPPSDHWQCKSGPTPLSTTEPNVLVIDGNGIDYGAGVENIFEEPGVPWRTASGPIAQVQHSGGTSSRTRASTAQALDCIESWIGGCNGVPNKWDVMTMGFGARDCCPGDGHPGHHPVPLSAYLNNVKPSMQKK